VAHSSTQGSITEQPVGAHLRGARQGRCGPMPMASCLLQPAHRWALRAPALDPVSRWQVEEVLDLARQFMPVETRIGTGTFGRSWRA
jgi:hypothetical protein